MDGAQEIHGWGPGNQWVPVVLGRHSAEDLPALCSPRLHANSSATAYGCALTQRGQPTDVPTRNPRPLAQASPFFYGSFERRGHYLDFLFPWPGPLSVIFSHRAKNLTSNTRPPLMVCHPESMRPMMLAGAP